MNPKQKLNSTKSPNQIFIKSKGNMTTYYVTYSMPIFVLYFFLGPDPLYKIFTIHFSRFRSLIYPIIHVTWHFLQK